MVLDTKKGLLKADKEKGQYVDSEKGKGKENRKKNFVFVFDVVLTLEHRQGLRSSANKGAAIQFFFTLFFTERKLGLGLPLDHRIGLRAGNRCRALLRERPARPQNWSEVGR
jgi:hypothetical protein